MYYSPLRYPGGKARLAPFMEYMMKYLNHIGGTYIEPFAGGAGVAVELLEKGIVKRVVLNDYDKGIYSFWRAMLTETDRFISDISSVPLTIEEWERQHNICMHCNKKYSYKLGFATFYMNRTNRSGIIKGGVIGGKNQNGKWKIDARFNRTNLANRIKKLASRRNQIVVYNKDIRSFVKKYLPKYQDNALVYFDPPYYHKGRQLYLNFFNHEDHVEICSLIDSVVGCDWIITYDDIPSIVTLYANKEIRRFDLEYSASGRRKASELMVFKNATSIPNNAQLIQNNIFLNLRSIDNL